MFDPRVSDEATGLPPLDEIGTDVAMLAAAWASGEGLVTVPFTSEIVAVRYIHIRGLVPNPDGGPGDAEWAQVHIAVPVEHAAEVAAALLGTGRS